MIGCRRRKPRAMVQARHPEGVFVDQPLRRNCVKHRLLLRTSRCPPFTIATSLVLRFSVLRIPMRALMFEQILFGSDLVIFGEIGFIAGIIAGAVPPATGKVDETLGHPSYIGGKCGARRNRFPSTRGQSLKAGCGTRRRKVKALREAGSNAVVDAFG